MVTIKQLKKLITLEQKKKHKLNKVSGDSTEKARLKKKLFQLKYGSKIRVAKRVGKGIKTASGNLAYNVRSFAGSFQEQRKKKKGVGGFLQGIANKQ